MKAKLKAPSSPDVETGSRNVFADLGLPDPDDRRLRVQLAMRLIDLLEGMSQAAAAKRLGISRPHVSGLKRFKLARFSSKRLLHLTRRIQQAGDTSMSTVRLRSMSVGERHCG
ncbi:helix-turn-helix domain-containing protein [Ramlibacter albus]|uniref:XRE family transcriptional regulator n=1 Tax=Ramlibacter albus TaxID=2079448 RepID=A0A923MB17_9BURK|nr:helix-turn-helix transcriptional regulator [Ramlibacter albus]MBC5766063.1 XRE family transcriptional regulator [Ramlibacter albus]